MYNKLLFPSDRKYLVVKLETPAACRMKRMTAEEGF